jgi:Uma2 family endonuclease
MSTGVRGHFEQEHEVTMSAVSVTLSTKDDSSVIEPFNVNGAALYPSVATMTTKQFHDALERKIWGEGRRFMLIHGVVLEKPKLNAPHATALTKVTIALAPLNTTTRYLRIQQPLALGLEIDPLPDVALVSGCVDDHEHVHPSAALHVVEIADSTSHYDLTTKAELYARANIPEYWVLDVVNRQLHVLRDPRPLAVGGTVYHTQLCFTDANSVAPLVEPNTSIRVADLLPRPTSVP